MLFQARSLPQLVFTALLATSTFLAGCGGGEAPSADTAPISLVALWPDVQIDDPQTAPDLPPAAEIRFDGGGVEGVEWEIVSGIRQLRVEDGLLVGETTDEPPAILLEVPEALGGGDELWEARVRLRSTTGGDVAVFPLLPEGGPPVEAFLGGVLSRWPLQSATLPSSDTKTYSVNVHRVDSTGLPMAKTSFRRFLLRPTDEAGAEFAIESIRFVFRTEHLSTIASGPGWHGLGHVYRETLISRAPETLAFDVELPRAPWLDLAVGSVQLDPPVFSVTVDAGEGPQVAAVLEPEGAESWSSARIDLSKWEGESVRIGLEAESDDPGALAFWGGPTVRSSRTAGTSERPQTVVLFLADTLRRDHLELWGHDRPTAPHLVELASRGVVFEDTIAQSTWTKMSVPAILTALYPSSLGIADLDDRVSAGETTLAEIFREGGYATFATSSVPFTGQLTNLHQGVEVMYEYGASGKAEGDYQAKTSDVWVDAYLDWLETHRDVPTFALVHVMDPHSPFEPPEPYDELWATEEQTQAFQEQARKVEPHIENPMLRKFMAPKRTELEAAGVDPEAFVAHEKAWYDGSIRHMDDHLGRMLDRLEEWGLKENTLLAFVSDHGEEFLEHGEHWHGRTVYGEVANVPMVLWGRGVPSGVTVGQTVQTIDLLPTLADLAGLEVPERAQGRSLAPLLEGDEGGRNLPAFTERRHIEVEGPVGYSSFSIVEDRWKLVWNVGAPESVPEYELFDHREDPLNQVDVADEHPELVERLSTRLARWKSWAESQEIDREAVEEEMSAEELEQLRSLGYVD